MIKNIADLENEIVRLRKELEEKSDECKKEKEKNQI